MAVELKRCEDNVDFVFDRLKRAGRCHAEMVAEVMRSMAPR